MPPKRRASSRVEDAPKGSGVKRLATEKAVESSGSKSRRSLKLKSFAPLNVAPGIRFRIFMMGEGTAGELGLGPHTKQAYRPRLNHNLDPESVGVVALAVGCMHAAAITHDNRIITWGVNDNFALGRDTTWEGGWRDIDGSPNSEEADLNPYESTPSAVPHQHFASGAKFVEVAASDSATFVLTADGYVYGWGTFRDSNGNNSFSVGSNGEIVEKQREPMLIPFLKNIVKLSAGGDYVLALDSSGVVFSWGNNEQHQLGRRLLGRREGGSPLLPGRIGFWDIVSIHTATYHAFAINKSGYVWAWGANHLGQTGIPQGAGEGGAVVFPPQKVTSLPKKKMNMIEGGNHHSIGLTDDGTCLVWGCVSGFQMGLDLKTIRDAPGVISDFRGNPRVLMRPTAVPIPQCAYISSGNDYNLALTTSGSAYSWGLNASGQCGQGPDDDEDEEPEDSVTVATPIVSSAIGNQKVSWAGAGAQFSILACPVP